MLQFIQARWRSTALFSQLCQLLLPSDPCSFLARCCLQRTPQRPYLARSAGSTAAVEADPSLACGQPCRSVLDGTECCDGVYRPSFSFTNAWGVYVWAGGWGDVRALVCAREGKRAWGRGEGARGDAREVGCHPLLACLWQLQRGPPVGRRGPIALPWPFSTRSRAPPDRHPSQYTAQHCYDPRR